MAKLKDDSKGVSPFSKKQGPQSSIKIKQDRSAIKMNTSADALNKLEPKSKARYRKATPNPSVVDSLDTHKGNQSKMSSSNDLSGVSSKQFSEISDMVRNVIIWKYKLEMLAELAGFFSQHSKSFKHDEESSAFLR